jgi:hypothetical protein
VTSVKHPRDRRSRAAARKKIRAVKIARAEADARRLARSIKCGGYGLHAGEPDGCTNDGSTCLCECHDGPESNANASSPVSAATDVGGETTEAQEG